MNTWVGLADGPDAYYIRHDPLTEVVLPVVCLEIGLACILFALWEFCRRRQLQGSALPHWLFLAACLLPLTVTSIAVSSLIPDLMERVTKNRWFWYLTAAAAVGWTGAAAVRAASLSRWMRHLLLYSWPVLLVVLGNDLLRGALRFRPSDYADGPMAAVQAQPPRARVVWIIFDEMSEAIAFGQRPRNLRLPEFDRLRNDSFYGTSAHSPGASTAVSMPALTIGEPVSTSSPNGPRELILRMPSRSSPVSWSLVPNVFDAARAMGFNTALVGWYHAYGRVLNRSLTRCYWTGGLFPSGVEERVEPQPLLASILDRAWLQFARFRRHVPGADSALDDREEKCRRFALQVARSAELAADASIGLSLLHLQVPHPPSIYNRATGVIGAAPGNGYLDGMALADRTLGDLCRTLERAGLWDRTTILISADHGWRTARWREVGDWNAEDEANSHTDTSGVPFLVKLAGRTEALEYGKPFDTIVTRSLILEILAGRVTSASDVQRWIERPVSLTPAK
jgi:hypothetical protein